MLGEALIMTLCCLVPLTECQVRLFQRTEVCPSQEAAFYCVNENYPSLFWKISNGMDHIYFNFNSNFDQIGTVQNNMIARSGLRAKLVSGNSSFIMSSLTIEEPFRFNSSTINCNDEEVSVFNIGIPDISDLLKVTFHQLNSKNETYRFLVMWNLMDLEVQNHYFISVYPPPPYGPVNWTSNGSAETLSFNNNTVYNVTISVCPYRILSSYFIIGRCSFFPELRGYMYYEVWSNGTTLVRCSEGKNVFAECGIHGEWIANNEYICSRNVADVASTVGSGATENLDMKLTYAKKTQQCGPVAAGASAALTLVAILASIIAFSLGLLCGVYNMKKKLKKNTSVLLGITSPIYEEIYVADKVDDMKVFNNTAYGEAHET